MAKSVLKLAFRTALLLCFLPLLIVYRFVMYVLTADWKRQQAVAGQLERLNQAALDEVTTPCSSRRVKLDHITLHVVTSGDPTNPVAVLLHGFPSCWAAWSKVIPRLVEAGYYVVCPDMRGYGLSDKPKGKAQYTTEFHVADMKALIKHFSPEDKVLLVGHDWGATVAVNTAMHAPELVDRLVFMNGVHPVSFFKQWNKSFRQKLMSWYMIFFQLPWVPEFLVTSDKDAVGTHMKQARKNKGAITKAEAELTVAGWLQPYAMTAQINYYRSMFSSKLKPKIITMPTLCLFGANDPHLMPECNHGLDKKWVPNIRMVDIPECGHWTPEEKPEEVAAAILEWAEANDE